ncbi:MAG TPA: leucine-rich repeat protein [Candidatus Saccharimonadales bacterium]|nr:leucine-rich repeat protein [Candidatus Saccharimonadales bacterium]
MKKIITIALLLLSFNLQPSSTIHRALQYVPPEEKTTTIQSTSYLQSAHLQKLLNQYWHYLKTGQGKFIDLINRDTKQNGIKELGIFPADIEKMELYARNFLMSTPIEEFAHSRLPEWLAAQYDNLTDEVALDWENFMEHEGPIRLGVRPIRRGVIDHMLHSSHKKYHFVKKEFKNNQQYKRSKSYRNAENDLIEASKKYQSIEDIIAHKLIDSGVEYVIVSAVHIRNVQILDELKKILNNNPQLKIIVAFDDSDTITPLSFTVPDFIEHLIIVGRNLIRIEDDFLFANQKLKVLDLRSLSWVRLIGNRFLVGCASLIKLYMEGLNINQIGDSFLANCRSLVEIDLKPLSRVTHIGNYFLGTCISLTNIDLKPLSNVTQIGTHFLTFTNITSIDLTPLSQIRSIPNEFLSACNITHINLSPLSRVTRIGDIFLGRCQKLAEIDLTPLSNVTDIGHDFLIDCPRLILIDIRPLSNVINIGDNFLADCKGLVDIYSSTPFMQLRNLGGSFLAGCENLERVDLRLLSGITQIEDYFLGGCFKLKNINLRPLSKVKRIGSHFLFMCESLKQVDLRLLSQVEDIKPLFLDGCKGLEKLIMTEKIFLMPAVQQFIQENKKVVIEL